VPLSEEALRERLASQSWTAHNIELLPGVFTLPGTPPFVTTNLHLLSMLQVLDLLYPGGLQGLRVADLGCLEGGFALAFAQRGAEVVAVEARPDNLAKCALVKEQFGLPNLTFREADVKTFEAGTFGHFDVVLAMGILYHLDQPAAWLDAVARATRGVLFVDTHYAPADDHALAALDPRLKAIGPLEDQSFRGWPTHGRWFEEYQTEAQRVAMPWASFSNPRSFWLTKGSLVATLRVLCGFEVVMEQYDHYALQYETFTTSYPRCMMVGLKPAGVVSGRATGGPG
jgi:2-polyprenyl-3-methyl-5-hydroxy-6-metoxy-1,4-benzoquinol methylase